MGRARGGGDCAGGVGRETGDDRGVEVALGRAEVDNSRARGISRFWITAEGFIWRVDRVDAARERQIWDRVITMLVLRLMVYFAWPWSIVQTPRPSLGTLQILTLPPAENCRLEIGL